MKKGKYESKKRKRINWLGVCFWILLLAVIVVGVILLSKSCSEGDVPPESTPETSLLETSETTEETPQATETTPE